MSKVDVVVLGGGFAGAVATRELAEAGYTVELLEARDRLGGRTWFKADVLDGRPLEMGGQFLSPNHELVYGEIKRYGLPHTIRSAHGLADHWIVGGERIEGEIPALPEELGEWENLIVELRTVAARIDPRLPLTDQFSEGELAELDVPATERMLALGIPERVVEIASLVVSPYFAAETLERISWLHLCRMVAAAGGVYALVGGDSLILDAGTIDLANAIVADSGVTPRLETVVESVLQTGEGVRVIHSGGTTEARLVVCALPLPILADVEFDPPLHPLRMEAAQARNGREGSKTWAVLRNAPEGLFAEGRTPGLHQMAAFEQVEDGLLVYAFGPPDEWLNGDDREEVEKRMREFLPEVEVVRSAAHDWSQDPFTKGAWSHYAPGEIRRFERVLRESEGRVVFAGGETALRYCGYIEGAVESGFRAAADAVGLLRASEPVAAPAGERS